jgi:ATP-dependent helicase YprA (DUF1998 family)
LNYENVTARRTFEAFIDIRDLSVRCAQEDYGIFTWRRRAEDIGAQGDPVASLHCHVVLIGHILDGDFRIGAGQHRERKTES